MNLLGADGCKTCSYLEWAAQAYPEKDIQRCADCGHLFVPWIADCVCDPDMSEFPHKAL